MKKFSFIMMTALITSSAINAQLKDDAPVVLKPVIKQDLKPSIYYGHVVCDHLSVLSKVKTLNALPEQSIALNSFFNFNVVKDAKRVKDFCCSGENRWCIQTQEGADLVNNHEGTNYKIGDWVVSGSNCTSEWKCDTAEIAVCNK